MKRFTLALAILAALAAAVPALAADLHPTPTWMGIYGSVSFRGAAVAKGDEVRAYTPEGILVGRFEIEKDPAGEYGFLPIYGDDPTTAAKDGAAAGDVLRIVLFRVSDGQEYALQHAGAGPLEFAAGGDELRLDLMF